jgi:hypothetical protein
MSAFLLPILFAGAPVDSPRAGAEAIFYLALPLRWTFSNAGQAGYMILNFCVLLAFADYCSTRSVDALIRAFSYSGLIVVGVGFYQMLAGHFGLPFPSSFFNSNGAWAQNYKQIIGAGWHRVSATFVEPSEAGGFLSSWLLFELILANGGNSRLRHWLFAVLGVVVLLATTSSTGYATIALILAFMCLRLTVYIFVSGTLPTRTTAIVVCIVIVGAGFLFLGHDASLLDAVLWNKTGSSSAVHRFATVSRAISVIGETYGLGAGLGSNRAFGMLAYIGSNLGIFGLLIFVYLVVQLYTETYGMLRAASYRSDSRVRCIACALAFSANLIGAVLSGAEISAPSVWVAWGLLLAALQAQRLLAGSEAYIRHPSFLKNVCPEGDSLSARAC